MTFCSDTIQKLRLSLIKNDKEKPKLAGESAKASTSSPVTVNSKQEEKESSKRRVQLPRFAPELDGVHCFETIVPY